MAEERKLRGDRALVNVLRHMLIVREFETMLGEFKSRGAYAGIDFAYKGPAHLSVGQEGRSEEHTSELQSQSNLVCRLLLEKNKNQLEQQHFEGNISIEYEHNWEHSVPDVSQCIGFVRGYEGTKK